MHVVFVRLPVGVLWHVFVRTHTGDSQAVTHDKRYRVYVVYVVFVGFPVGVLWHVFVRTHTLVIAGLSHT